MSTSRRELNKIKSRKRILRASRKLFSSKGYDATMMEDIAQSAEVSKATVYNYFSSKESLLTGTAQEVLDMAKQLAEKQQKNGMDSLHIIRNILDAFVHASIAFPDISRRITYLSTYPNSALYHIYEDLFELLYELVEKSKTEGFFRKEADSREIIDVVMGIMLIAQFQWDDPEKLSDKERKTKIDSLFDSTMKNYFAF